MPPASLDTLKVIPARAARISSLFNGRYPASNAIDGSLSSLAASKKALGNWLSVRVAPGTSIGYVAVHNRQDRQRLAALLGTFEVWVGSSYGDTTSADAVKCGEASYSASRNAAPYVLWCGTSSGSYVTLKQTGKASFLTVCELQVFS